VLLGSSGDQVSFNTTAGGDVLLKDISCSVIKEIWFCLNSKSNYPT